MIIRSANIALVNRRSPIKAEMHLGGDDLVDNCEITGGVVCIGEGTSVLFRDCFIKDCEYSLKEINETVPPSSVVINCIVKDCKLPLGYYVSCVFENDGRREYSRLFSLPGSNVL